MLYQLLKRLYHWLPFSPGQRYRFGQYKRKLQRAWQGLSGQALPLQVFTADAASSSPAALPAPPSAPLGDPQSPRDFVFFGVIDWHFRHQRPQQLALSIAQEGHRVFYVSVNFVDSDEPGFGIESLHDSLPLYQVFFHLPGPHSVYAGAPTAQTLQRLREDQRLLWQQYDIRKAVHVVQHPYWHGLASFVPPARLVYDCMDFHAGFANTGDSHGSVELQLLRLADLTIVTSDYLVGFAQRSGAKKVALIRNAAEFEHFHPAHAMARTGQAPVIGYYGAIAEWFDAGLIEALSKRFPQARIELIGADTAQVQERLRHCPNVRLHGEKPYAELPQWLAQFDVCLIPFRINELTLATNPVKVYEYLSAGKAVVGTDLPELAQFGDLVYRAHDEAAFVQAVERALGERQHPDTPALQARRIAFAREQTWHQRAQDLLQAAAEPALEPLTSVMVVSYNQWHLTERCLRSLEDNSDTNHLQLIVVDNASADETPQRLQAWAAQDPARRQIVLNRENLGFGPAVNQGLALSHGEYLVILNNDIIVGPGWARGLRRHLEVDPGLGLLCPVTNNIGNEAQVALKGSTPPEVFESARHYNLGRTGQLLPLNIAAFFCVMMHRRIYEALGGLDEQFVPGFFEDDDYCLRVKALGLRVGCAEDVFVYHELSASFDKVSIERRQAIFERNKALFEKKWGAWQPHVYRPESLH